LFVSDISGKGLKQVSPHKYQLLHWQTISEANKVLIQALKDDNQDLVFDDDDEIVSFVYDVETQKLEEVFGEVFNLKSKKLLEKQWAKK
jgi:hypothetical protein